jgi:hypothetical protein
VLCAGSTLLLVQSKALDEAPYKLSGAVAKLASITFSSLPFSYWFDKPRFLTKGKLATVLIIPSSWGSQLGGYLPTSPTTHVLFDFLPKNKLHFGHSCSPSTNMSPQIFDGPLTTLTVEHLCQHILLLTLFSDKQDFTIFKVNLEPSHWLKNI